MNWTVEKDREFGYRNFLPISTGKKTLKKLSEKEVVGVLPYPSVLNQ
jgi:hypothetical protein